MENKLNLDTEFILVSEGGDFKRVKYSKLVSYFNKKYEASTSNTAGVKGQKGLKGEKGESGAIGLQGYRGITGQDGGFGEFGDDGEQGEKGAPGELGIIGSKGLKGISGSNGVKGSRGELGTTGDKGQKGSKGQLGLVGEKGEKGIRGSLIKGIKGRKGVKGFGKQGNRGDKGEKGEQGEKGDTGDIGYTGRVNNVITQSTDLNTGSWTIDKIDITSINIKEEFGTSNSRTLVKVKRGKYYNRFILKNSSFSEIGTQLNDPLRNCYTPFNHLIYDTISDTEIPLILTTDETNRITQDGSNNTLVTENFIVCKIFYEGTFKIIPFTTYVTDKF